MGFIDCCMKLMITLDYNDFEPLIYQAACLVHLYASHGIDPVVLAFEIDETLRAIPKQRGIKWLYYNAIKVALKDRCETP